MATKNLLRDSLIIMAMVILFAYAASLTLSLLTTATPPNEVAGQVVLVVLLVLVVLGLGFVLWRSEIRRSSS
jgi:drug/metabolite transporter (DMT)-like permease